LSAGIDRRLAARAFGDLLAEAVAFHGHLCPGQALGTRMTALQDQHAAL
jgi:formylmethanofuran dehydrogenase subunit E